MKIQSFLFTAIIICLELSSGQNPINLAWAEVRIDSTKAICDRDLEKEIQKSTLPQLKAAHIGVVVDSLASQSSNVVNLNGDKLFVPASNIKLFTTAAALQLLGKDYRITTSLMSKAGPNAQGEVENLWLIGRGDPSFQSDSSLKLLVKQLVERGVKRIKGQVNLLPTLRGSGIANSWEWQDLQEYYGAIASSFTIDENSLYWTVIPTQSGQAVQFKWDKPQLAANWIVQNLATTSSIDGTYSLKVERPPGQNLLIITGQIPQNAEPELGGTAIPNPQAYFLLLLQSELKRQGIVTDVNFAESISPRFNQPPAQELSLVFSPPLQELIRTINKDSNNLYAELILRGLGSLASEVKLDDNLPAGILMVAKFLKNNNVSVNNLFLVDGSGLSRHNLTTPKTLVQVLKVMANNVAFRNSLPIAGIDGSLANRFKDSPAQGKLTAKTGSMTGVSALSGYVKPANYDELAFSIMINNSNQSSKVLREQIDAIALLLSRVQRCK